MLARFESLRFGQFIPAPQVNAMPRQCRHDLRRESASACCCSIGRSRSRIRTSRSRPSAGRILAQHRHALHEELVEVRGEDGEELHPLEQRRALIERFRQHTPVELEPAQVAIDPYIRQR